MKTNAEMQEEAAQSLEKYVPVDGRSHNDLKSETNFADRATKDKIIKNANNEFLINCLSPEISKNEHSKRWHKYILILLLAVFLVIQFFAVRKLSIGVMDYATSGRADINIVNSLLAFVSAYITSVVIELIAILRYIVKNVFDTSLAELVKIFREEKTEIEHSIHRKRK